MLSFIHCKTGIADNCTQMLMYEVPQQTEIDVSTLQRFQDLLLETITEKYEPDTVGCRTTASNETIFNFAGFSGRNFVNR